MFTLGVGQVIKGACQIYIVNLIAHDCRTFLFKCPHPQEKLFQWRLFTSEVDIACESRCLFWLLFYPEEPKKTFAPAG